MPVFCPGVLSRRACAAFFHFSRARAALRRAFREHRERTPVPVRVAIAAALMLSACAEPPNKEVDQAQGAIDAARAAGAEQYAPQELAAAVTALNQSREAVTQGDYRSALSSALDSRERAQDAAKQASNERAAFGSQTERTLAQVRALLDRGD